MQSFDAKPFSPFPSGSGKTVLLSSHLLADVEENGGRVLVVNKADLARPRSRLLPLLEQCRALGQATAAVLRCRDSRSLRGPAGVRSRASRRPRAPSAPRRTRRRRRNRARAGSRAPRAPRAWRRSARRDGEPDHDRTGTHSTRSAPCSTGHDDAPYARSCSKRRSFCAMRAASGR